MNPMGYFGDGKVPEGFVGGGGFDEVHRCFIVVEDTIRPNFVTYHNQNTKHHARAYDDHD